MRKHLEHNKNTHLENADYTLHELEQKEKLTSMEKVLLDMKKRIESEKHYA